MMLLWNSIQIMWHLRKFLFNFDVIWLNFCKQSTIQIYPVKSLLTLGFSNLTVCNWVISKVRCIVIVPSLCDWIDARWLFVLGRTVLESHHVSFAFRLTHQDVSIDIFQNLHRLVNSQNTCVRLHLLGGVYVCVWVVCMYPWRWCVMSVYVCKLPARMHVGGV